MKKRIGPIAVIVLALIPLLMWSVMMPLSQRFSDFNTSFRSFGQAFALIGVVLFSLTFVLNSRLKFLEDYFGGLDKMLLTHHVTGTIAFVLLLFHPMFLAATLISVSFKDAASFLLPGEYWMLNFGIIALVLMEIILILTFFGRLKYHNWKNLHRFLGVALIIGALHVILIPSDITSNAILRYYVLSMVFLGIALYLYRTWLDSFLVKKSVYFVSNVKHVNKNVHEVTLSAKANAIRHLPAQFIFLSFQDKYLTAESHPFTISSSPKEDRIRVSIKESGDYTSKIGKLKKGTIAKIEGPFGRFYDKSYADKEQIWIAGGIGITPFLSFSRSLEKNRLIELYYSFAEKDDSVFLDELLELSGKNRKFKVYDYCTKEKGYLNAEYIRKKSSLKNKEIFICGPPAMMFSLIEQFLTLGVPKKKIHYEEFTLI